MTGRRDRMLIETSGLFDQTWYIERNPNLKNIAPVKHYLFHGWRQGRAPGPNFDGDWYLRNYPDVAASGINPLVHYVRFGQAEGRLRGLSNNVVETLKASLPAFISAEPTIANEPSFECLHRLPLNLSILPTYLARAWDRIFSNLVRPYERLIFVPSLVRGGAELVAANVAFAAIDQHGPRTVLVVVTDSAQNEAQSWLPSQADVLIVPECETRLSHDDRTRLVEMLIWTIRPAAVLNINSRACWDALLRRGRALSNVTTLYAAAFCRDFDDKGKSIGYADSHLAACLPNLTKLYCDNETFRRYLITNYKLPPSLEAKIQFLPQPASREIKFRGFITNRQRRRMRVLWSGRIVRQKNVDVLLSIVRRAPHIEFEIFGSIVGSEGRRLEELQREVSNLSLGGEFASITELATEEYAAYLFTSRWEGLPNTLISVAALGLPIIASNVGGVSELVNEQTGWLVDNIEEPDGYLRSLDEIWSRPQEALRRVEAMLQYVERRHSWAAYERALNIRPSFLS
ncbi:glycosyltransferase involved in cell wall biosynthesis [Bradyrhizobium elkanii]